MKSRHFAFILTMPNVGSWNGKWSAADKVHAIVQSSSSRKWVERRESLIGDYFHNWGDGWGANLEVKEVDALEAKRLRKVSAGFCGYDWMVENIVSFGATARKEVVAA